MGTSVRRAAVVGGGIIGTAVARERTRRLDGAEVVLLEKEDELAAHQTGHIGPSSPARPSASPRGSTRGPGSRTAWSAPARGWRASYGAACWGPGVVVEAGATVSDSVLLADTTVEAGAEVAWTVVDSGCVIGRDARLGAPDAKGTEDPDQVTLVGKDSSVTAGTTVAVGARLEPGTTA